MIFGKLLKKVGAISLVPIISSFLYLELTLSRTNIFDPWRFEIERFYCRFSKAFFVFFSHLNFVFLILIFPPKFRIRERQLYLWMFEKDSLWLNISRGLKQEFDLQIWRKLIFSLWWSDPLTHLVPLASYEIGRFFRSCTGRSGPRSAATHAALFFDPARIKN